MLEFKATLRVCSETHSLKSLITAFGESGRAYSLGDVVSGRKKTKTYWSKRSSLPSAENVDLHLSELLDFLDLRKSKLADMPKDCEMDIFCMLSSNNGQGGAILSSKVLKRLSSHDVNLVLDVYCEDLE